MNWPAGTVLWIIYAAPGVWSSGPSVIAEDHFPEEWIAVTVADARERGCDVVKAVVQ